MADKIIPIKLIPFEGGVDSFHEAVTLPRGGYSRIQNIRFRRPGFESRLGQAKHHTTTDNASNAVISGYGFSKGRTVERTLFAQYDDGSVEKATDNPPTVTTGNFASTTVLAARSNPAPASWANFRDYLIYADGAGQAQIYTGTLQTPLFVNVYKGTEAIPDVPEEGADYTPEATDGLAATVVDLDSLDTLANYGAVFVGFDTPINKLTLTVSAVNGNASVATLSYRKNDSTWADSSDTDGTASGGASIAQTGSFTWTLPTDEIPHYAFGRSCFIYRIDFSAALDAEVEVSAITGENTAGFQTVQNVWDGVMVDAIEALVFDSSATTYATYSSQSIKPGGLVGGASYDYIYFNSLDPLFGFYLDVGKTPNTTATTTIDQVAAWTGGAWTAMTSLNDGTTGGANSGFVTWARDSTVRKLNFNSSRYHAYWYRIRFDKTLSSSLTWALQTMPYFEINNIYPVCQCVAVWDKRPWYSFNDNHLYGTTTGYPMSLNGDDLVLLQVGDFRANKILAMRRFYNFMLVWQEEKGEEGGGFHIIEPGATAAGYATQVISDKIGIMNSKCAVVLEDVGMVDLNTERPVMKGVYFVSRYGVFKTDGSFLRNISGGITNYFDSTKSENIRAGYEGKHFLEWDSLYRVLRLGLVSGSTATEPNVFFVYNYATDQWATDILGQPLSSIFEVEAASGDVPVLQYGGTQDGYVLRLNTTDDDITTVIDKSIKIELDGEGWQIRLNSLAFIMKSQTAGKVIVDIYREGAADPEFTEALSMINAGADYVGHRFNVGVSGDHLTIHFRNSKTNQPVYLLKYGVDIEKIHNVAYD